MPRHKCMGGIAESVQQLRDWTVLRCADNRKIEENRETHYWEIGRDRECEGERTRDTEMNTWYR